ncbi:hypothetical protein CCP4SC76_2140001 [Gammaproteobacteria bacterium]
MANLTLDAAPHERSGAPPAWDNVLYDSPALGYVRATHQAIRRQPGGATVLTYYWALCDEEPAVARHRLLTTPWAVWAETILAELAKPHPDIRERVQTLDLVRWGHAMSIPYPGWMVGEARRVFHVPWGRVHFAHSDLSGLSLFEEAQHWGIKAAEGVLGTAGLAVEPLG